MHLSEEVAGKIQDALTKFIANPELYVVNFDFDQPPDLRKLAVELKLLPVMLDMGGCRAIRSDGQIFSFPWEPPLELTSEDDPRIINIVFYRASQKYPELAALRPQKPNDAQLCPHCKGTGDPTFGTDFKNTYNNLVCYCGNLGWLPPDYKVS